MWCEIRQAFPFFPSSLCVSLSWGLFISQVHKMGSLISCARHRANYVVDQNTMDPALLDMSFSCYRLNSSQVEWSQLVLHSVCDVKQCSDVQMFSLAAPTGDDPVFSDNDVSCSGHPMFLGRLFFLFCYCCSHSLETTLKNWVLSA